MGGYIKANKYSLQYILWHTSYEEFDITVKNALQENWLFLILIQTVFT